MCVYAYIYMQTIYVYIFRQVGTKNIAFGVHGAFVVWRLPTGDGIYVQSTGGSELEAFLFLFNRRNKAVSTRMLIYISRCRICRMWVYVCVLVCSKLKLYCVVVVVMFFYAAGCSTWFPARSICCREQRASEWVVRLAFSVARQHLLRTSRLFPRLYSAGGLVREYASTPRSEGSASPSTCLTPPYSRWSAENDNTTFMVALRGLSDIGFILLSTALVLELCLSVSIPERKKLLIEFMMLISWVVSRGFLRILIFVDISWKYLDLVMVSYRSSGSSIKKYLY